ncbi:DUF605-domain-containing protein [Pseudovirgaria hyperparasitica]|uniref:DUF605-domain-containing protein n=1 Tax=Pseudovirgaria hyperparasitica TaxID=470096 RepID=A0A6A6VU48_9PEZI|nr:DUF605-domain-containing protein [Pseudovirgaria hyperparasitica]KAF2754102.1 DUF605-domain-containing protein [Pseudovirgaria hyperparasitica]
MSTNLPAGLRAADISRFALRASQLQKFKPAIAYWCQYYIVQQILTKGLHKLDSECEAYTIDLMSKLEQSKDALQDNDAVTDDVAAQAYVEQFAQETFQRADNSIRSNKASSSQTADTFRAAATFLDMLTIWTNPLDAETAAKSKFAKFHALRIAKALKAGEDPNLSNPPPEDTTASEAATGSAPVLDPNDPEVQRIQHGTSSTYQPPNVASAPSSPAFSARMSPPIPPIHPQNSYNMPDAAATPNPHDVSPLSPDSRKNSASAASTTSAGGGYFPTVPTFTSDSSAPSLPTAPPPEGNETMNLPSSSHTATAPPAMTPDPSSFYTQTPPPQTFSPPPGWRPPQPQLHTTTSNHNPPQPQPQPQPPQQQSQSRYHPTTTTTPFKPDEDAMLSAQKHAKWAISALNFEDSVTAIKELRNALADLEGWPAQ